MKTHHIYILIILILISFNIYNLLFDSNLKNEFIQLKNSYVRDTSLYCNDIRKKNEYFDDIFHNYITNEDKLKLINEYPDFASKLKSGEKVILYFNNNVCGSCLKKVLQDLDILATKIGRERIVITTTLNNNGIPLTSEDYNFKHFYIKTFYLTIEKYNYPIVFIMDKNMNIKLLYVSEMFPDFQQTFFSEILPNYFNSRYDKEN